MTSTLGGVPSGSFSYDANDRLSVDTYNNNGNTTASGGITNNYDFEDRMTQHGSVTLVYDGDGNRVSETAGGVTTKYLIDDLNPTGLPQALDEIERLTRSQYEYDMDMMELGEENSILRKAEVAGNAGLPASTFEHILEPAEVQLIDLISRFPSEIQRAATNEVCKSSGTTKYPRRKEGKRTLLKVPI